MTDGVSASQEMRAVRAAEQVVADAQQRLAEARLAADEAGAREQYESALVFVAALARWTVSTRGQARPPGPPPLPIPLQRQREAERYRRAVTGAPMADEPRRSYVERAHAAQKARRRRP